MATLATRFPIFSDVFTADQVVDLSVLVNQLETRGGFQKVLKQVLDTDSLRQVVEKTFPDIGNLYNDNNIVHPYGQLLIFKLYQDLIATGEAGQNFWVGHYKITEFAKPEMKLEFEGTSTFNSLGSSISGSFLEDCRKPSASDPSLSVGELLQAVQSPQTFAEASSFSNFPEMSQLNGMVLQSFAVRLLNECKEDSGKSIREVFAECLLKFTTEYKPLVLKVCTFLQVVRGVIASLGLKEEIYRQIDSGQTMATSLVLAYLCEEEGYFHETHDGNLKKVVGAGLRKSFSGVNIVINLKYVIMKNGEGFNKAGDRLEFAYSPTCNIKDFPIRKLTQEDLETHILRGKEIAQARVSMDHLEYTGLAYVFHRNRRIDINATGRCMRDPYQFFYENGSNRLEVDYCDSDDDCNVESLTNEDFATMSSFIPMYSFLQKSWLFGEFRRFSPVVFQPEIFDKLVLPERRKERIMARVTAEGNHSVDLVRGKGAGRIILGCGGPGTGKTTTAEAVSELLQRPLYTISVGELGTNRKELERGLRSVLELSQRWQAITLLDEVDVFVHDRDGTDLERDAMTGVFLRVLEYYPGILFMTTNLVEHLDQAFLSRIAMILQYGALPSVSDRIKVWRNLSENLAMPEGIDFELLGELEINNRDVKNILNSLVDVHGYLQKGGDACYSMEALHEELEDYITSRNVAGSSLIDALHLYFAKVRSGTVFSEGLSVKVLSDDVALVQ